LDHLENARVEKRLPEADDGKLVEFRKGWDQPLEEREIHVAVLFQQRVSQAYLTIEIAPACDFHQKVFRMGTHF
jgi:hypothetical protein